MTKQLDYILVDSSLRLWLQDAQSSNCPDLGSDHRAVTIKLHIQHARRAAAPQKMKCRKENNRQINEEWPPVDIDKYKRELDIRIQDITVDANLTD
eukprot:55055-Karenia_brevis.AAC.1